jgi:D-alanyl-D-alanine carboxypeptidase
MPCSLSKQGRPWALGIALAAAVALNAGAASAGALLLVEADSGRVLHAEHATYPWYPASVTKIMTAYVTLRSVKEGRLSLDTVLTVSPNAVAQQPSKMGFNAGTQVTVDNALKMLMVKSANDMAVVLAEGVSGSIENFATDMNRAAQRLGMTQTSYVNPNGLPADEQITSARDLAILARAMYRELPEYETYWHIGAIRFGKRVMRNTNRLLESYPGADGMKTGFICASGFNIVVTATRGSRRFIAVVLGAHSSAQRAEMASRLLDKGFNSGGLSWLTPSLGNVETLAPIAAAPPNLREDICGKRKGRPPSEDSDEPIAQGPSDTASPLAMLTSSFGADSAKEAVMTSMVPVPVFVGPPKKQGDMQLASAPANKKQKRGTAAQSAAAPTPQAKPPVAAAATSGGELGASILPANSFAPARPAMSFTNSAAAAEAPAVPGTGPKPRAKPKAKPKVHPIAAKQ